jgi:hypothetical protein
MLEHYVLNLDGVKAGFVKSASGGTATADVINEPASPSYFFKKHLGKPKYEDIAIQMDWSLTNSVYDWIAASWQGNYQRKNGSVAAADFNLAIKTEREFVNALISEVTIPTVDASSKDAAYITVKFKPEFTRFKKSSGTAGPAPKSRPWVASNFKLDIPGLDCTKVHTIDTFTVKQANDKNEYPNLKISVSEASAQTWIDWHDDFLIKGNNADGKEKSGSLTFLGADLKTELASIMFFGLGVFYFSTDDNNATADQIKHVTVGLYCERMEMRGPK